MQDEVSKKVDFNELKAKGQKIYLCSFGDTRLGISICRFKVQAENMGAFDDIMIYTEASLPMDFKEDFKDKMYVKPDSGMAFWDSSTANSSNLVNSRGFGYWVWKPKVILMVLEQMKENDLLVYADIGCTFNPLRKDVLFSMLKETNENQIMGITIDEAEKKWNKADLLAYYNLLNDEKFLNSNQICATAIFLKKTDESLKIIKEWLDMFYTHFELIDDSPSKIANLPEFRENRHDQSIWSILNKKYKLKNFPSRFFYDRAIKDKLALNCLGNKFYLPKKLEEIEEFNAYIKHYGFQFYKRMQSLETIENKFNSLTQRQEEQKLANLKLDESVKKLKVKKLEKELGMKLSKLEPRVNLILSENLRVSAVARMRNHLAYKRGEALIICSKSFLGLLSLPFVLKFIENKHKKEQAAYQKLIKDKPDLAFKSMQNCRDYNEALKVEQYFTYQLGLAYIKARKTWYKGGFIRFYFEVKRLYKNYKESKGIK